MPNKDKIMKGEEIRVNRSVNKEYKGQLRSYIEENLAKGYPVGSIKSSLMKYGLDRSFVDNSLRGYRKNGVLLKSVLVISFVLLMASLLLFILPRPIGLAPMPPEITRVSYDYTDDVNLRMDENYEYIWELDNKGNLTSVRLSGEVSKGGYFEAYLEHDYKAYLIFNSSRLSREETEYEPIVMGTQDKARRTLDGIFEFNVVNKFDFDVDYSKLCTKWEVNDKILCYGNVDCCFPLESLGEWNDALYLSYGRYDSGLNNIITAQLIYYDVDLSVPYSNIVYSDVEEIEAEFYEEMISFEDVCIDTCLLPGFNASSYKLIFIVEDADLNRIKDSKYPSGIRIEDIEYTIEEDITFVGDAPELIKDIENIIIYKNQDDRIDLSEYFYDEDDDVLSYSVNEVEDISVVIRNAAARIIPEEDFTGKRYIYFTAFDGYYNINSNVFEVDVVEEPLKVGEVEVTEEVIKPRVVINQDVKWVKRVSASERVIDLRVDISPDAFDVAVRDIKEDKVISEDKFKVSDEGIIKDGPVYNAEKSIEHIDRNIERLEETRGEIDWTQRLEAVKESTSITQELSELENERNKEENKLTGYVVAYKEKGLLTKFFEWLFNSEITGYAVTDGDANVTSVIIEEIVEEIEVEYWTEGPISEEENIADGKRIFVSSEVHYEDILAYTYLDDIPQNSIKLYRIVNGSRELVDDVVYYDENNNELIDLIEWNIPSLSNATYEVSITVLNVHSNPNLYGNWTVMFDTIGIANLTITATRDISYLEEYTRWDDESEEPDLYDMKFLEIRCGDEILDYEWRGTDCSENECSVFIEDYSCNETGYEISEVLTPKKHVLRFNFNGQEAYAYNAVQNISECTALPSAGTYYLNESIIDSDYLDCIEVNADDIILDCKGNKIDGNRNNEDIEHGIFIAGRTNITIRNCTISDWGVSGIRLISANDNIMENLNISSNVDIGIYLSNSQDNKIIDSQFNGNNYGIFIRDGSDNVIYNNFFNNTNNFGFGGGIYDNTWHISKTSGTNIVNGKYLGGNFWAEPDGLGYSQTCDDSDGDAICDDAYTLITDNIDYLPLAVPDLTPPVVHLISPEDMITTNNAKQIFICNITDINYVANLTLYIWNSSGVLNYINTTELRGTLNETNWTYTLPYDDTFEWNCLGYDAAENSAWSEEGNHTLVLDATPPIVNIIYPVDGSNISSNSIELNASATDNLAPSLIYYWVINGTLNSTTIDSNSTFNASDGYYNLTLFVSDGLQNGSDTVYFRLDTIAPSWNDNETNASLTMVNGNAGFNITVSDNIGLSYYIFNWNGTGIWDNLTNGSISGYSAKLVIDKPILSGGRVIAYRWYANDSAGNWNMSLLRTFIVVNTVPTHTIPIINSSDLLNRTNGTIYCWNQSTYDADGDLVINYYRWFNNSKLIVGENTNSLGQGNFSKGDNIGCEITPGDLIGNGTPLNSTILTIVNSAPTIPYVSYPQNGMNYSDIPYINYSSTDMDGDLIIYYIYINGILNITSGVNVTDWNASDGYYNLTVSAYDGSVFSDNSSVIYFMLDATAPVVNLISPVNDTFTTITTHTFSCNITDVMGVVNLTLNIWNSSGNNILVNTTNLSGAFNQTNWTYTLPYEDTFSWNCLGYDSFGNSNWGNEGNYSITYTHNIIECTTITTPGYYYMDTNIIDADSSPCINIEANDVVLDCNGYKIDGNGEAQEGIYIRRISSNNTNITIRNCTISDWSSRGIYMWRANYNILENLNIVSNPNRGVYLRDSHNNNITNSRFVNNSRGIRVYSSSNNTIYNNLFNDTYNFSFAGTIYNNTWNMSKTSEENIVRGVNLGGNFWANLNGTGFSQTCNDADWDEICDENYTLTVGNIDYLPLAVPDLIPPNGSHFAIFGGRDGAITNNVNIIFTINATDNIQLSQVTLYIWNSSGNLVFPLQTVSISGLFAEVSWPEYTFTYDDAYVWSALIYDKHGNSAWTKGSPINWTLIIDTTPPTVHLVSPENNTNTTIATQTFTCNVSDKYGVKNLTLFIWNSSGVLNYRNTVDAPGGFSEISWIYTLPHDGTFLWNCLGYDLAKNYDWSDEGNYTINLNKTPLWINFTSPTPPNGTVTTDKSVEIKMLVNTSSLSIFKWNWNKTNYTFYDNSLVLMMNFDNVSALGENYDNTEGYTVKDLSIYRNDGIAWANGTATDGPVWNSTGKYGGAFEFDGVDDYIEVNVDESLNITSNLTVSAWFYYSDGMCKGGQDILMAKDDVGGPNGRSWTLHCDDSNHIARPNSAAFEVHTSSGVDTIGGLNDSLKLNGWNYVTATFDSDYIGKIYVNGNLGGEESIGAPLNSVSTNITIGGRMDSSDPSKSVFFNGTIDEVRIWNRVLSAEEVEQQYYSNLRKYDTDQWDFYTRQIVDEPYINYTYTYYGYAEDINGYGNKTETRYWTVLGVPPHIGSGNGTGPWWSHSPINNSRLNTSNITFRWTVPDVSDITCDLIIDGVVNKSNLVTGPGVPDSESIPGLSEGMHNWSLICRDIVGNAAGSGTFVFLVDTIYPKIIFVDPTLPNGSTTGEDYIIVNVSAADDNYISAFIDFEDSLVGWWRFSETSLSNGSTLHDYSSYGNDGTVYADDRNGNARNIRTTAGYFGSAGRFDGDGDYVNVIAGNNSIFDFGSSNFTLGAWFKIRAGADGTIIGALWGVSSDQYRLDVLDTGAVRFRFSDGDIQTMNSSTAYDDNKWHHVIGVRNGTKTGKLYVDGVLVDEQGNNSEDTPNNPTFSVDIFTNLSIGMFYDGIDYFNGTIDDVMMFNRALSPEEIRGLYANTSTKYVLHNFSNLKDGIYEFKAYAQDLGGNVGSTEERTVTVDTTAPEIEFIKPTPSDDSIRNDDYIFVNVSSSDELSYISTFIDFDDSLVSWWRFDDVETELYDEAVAWWKFDEISGVSIADSIGSNTGTWEGIGGKDLVPTPSPTGSGLVFDGVVGLANVIPLPAGIVAHWSMDDNAATDVVIDSAGSDTGELVNGDNDMTSENSIAGKVNTALDFDGNDDYIQVSDSASLDVTSVTISAWAKISSQFGVEYIVTKMDDWNVPAFYTGSRASYGIQIFSGRVAFMVSDTGHAMVAEETISKLSTNTWHHIVGTYDGAGTHLIYVDGDLADSNGRGFASGPIYVGPGRLTIGALFNGWSGLYVGEFDGPIDDVMVFDRVLSPTEISSLYRDTSLITVPDDDTLDVTAVTMASWIKMDSEWSVPGVVIGKMEDYTAGGEISYSLYLSSGGNVVLGISDDGDLSTEERTTDAISKSAWHHIVGTYNGGGEYLLYVDGLLVASNGGGAASGAIYQGTGRLTIGARYEDATSTYASPFDGSIDQVAIFNRTLSDDEILELYQSDVVLDSSGNTVIDYTGRNDGTNYGAKQTELGYFGKGFEFDGINDYVEVQDDPSLSPSSITVSVWAKSNTENWNDHGFLFTKVSSLRINPLKDEKLVYYGIFDDATGWRGTFVNPPDITEWHMYTYTYDENLLVAYLDGVEIDSMVIGGGPVYDSTYPLKIGSDDIPGQQRYFNGTIDDVMIFNRSLSAEEIAALYANSTSKYLSHNFSNLEDGNHTFKAYAQDLAGNVNYTEKRTVELDTIKPNVNFEEPTRPNGDVTNETWLYVNVSASDSANYISTFIDFDNSLVGWWRFDDIRGDTVIDYTGGNDGTAYGDAEQTDLGYLGKGMDFDGDGDYVEVNDDASLDLTVFTTSAWIKINSFPKLENITYIIGKGEDSVTDNANYAMGIRSSLIWGGTNTLLCTFENSSDENFWLLFNLTDSHLNRFLHVACTLEGDDWRIYVDGEQVKTEMYRSTLPIGGLGGNIPSTSDAPLHLGSFLAKPANRLAYFFNGTIDDVMLFNRALSPEEIKALYANTSTKYVSNNFTDLGEGYYTFRGYAQDRAGNVNQDERTVRIDLTPPIIIDTKPTGTVYISTPILNITTDENATCRYIPSTEGNMSTEYEDMTYGNMTYDLFSENNIHHNRTLKLANGYYEFYARCKDELGNVMTESANISFTVDVVTVTVIVSSSGGGGAAAGVGIRKIAILEIDAPPEQTIFSGEDMDILITLENKGEIELEGIFLTTETNAPDTAVILSEEYFNKLEINEKGQLRLNVISLVDQKARIGRNRYYINLNVSVVAPVYDVSKRFFIDIEERNYQTRMESLQQIQFAEDLFKEHPECLEFNEVIKQAEDAYDDYDYETAISLIDSAIEACRDLIALEEADGIERPAPKKKANMALFVIEMVVLLALMSAMIYYYKRKKGKRAGREVPGRKIKSNLELSFEDASKEMKSSLKSKDIVSARKSYLHLYSFYKMIIASSLPEPAKSRYNKKLLSLYSGLAKLMRKR